MALPGAQIGLDTPVRFADPPPDAVDVAVIGGGVAGICTALYLARAGQRVVVLEKGRVAGEQSGRNWGWVRQQGRDFAELPIMMEAMRLWQGLAQEIGHGLGFRQTGVLYLADNAADMARYEDWMATARTHGLDTRVMGRAELDEKLPNAAGWIGGLWTGSDARAEPFVAVPLIAQLAQAAGARVIEACAVRALDISAGRVTGVVTENGRIAAERVVLAGGAWSALFARAHGVRLPQLSVRATVCATEPLPEFWAGAAADARFAFRRRADGGYTLAPGTFHEHFIGPDSFRNLRLFLPQIRRDLSGTRLLPRAPAGYPDGWGTPRRWAADQPSPFEKMRVLNPAPNMKVIEKLRDAFARTFPDLGRPAIARAWAGMIETTPDQVPVLDHTPLPGLTILTGLSGHGFGIGPGVGRVTADLVMGRDPGHDLHRFRFGRFSDGSAIELGPSL
ncbi:NAD(P)/FAD-dependent oxidoreductase [Paracoccus pacificus]|uniref:NAD(P)/FAD-dependent oxidoreductase n=1 Tax=Paracoccus pacificus TaxID=1463598 RepID=A0ABW4RAY0_9RHOB